MDDRGRLQALIEAVRPPAGPSEDEIRGHLDALTKPPGSLGRLEDLAVRVARVAGDPPPTLRPRSIFVFAADHGVAGKGVSAYPAEVTAQMCRNFAEGGAAVSVLARSCGAEVVVADLGVAGPRPIEGVRDRRIREGTGDISVEPAMTLDEARSAILAGADLFSELQPAPRLVALGEMGIGNSTVASVLTALLTGADPASVTGPGTGVGGADYARKVEVVQTAVARIDGRPGSLFEGDALELLAEGGGLEIAGLVGVALAAAGRGVAVVLDGFISTVAGALAVELAPALRPYLIASHHSAEPGHRLLLERLGLEPLLELELRLGEGSGAALAIPLIDGAAAILREMATFESAGVSGEREEVEP